ncbi:MAG: hypothetical protein WBB45_02785 [Cyclobacteriaceae bacterium]
MNLSPDLVIYSIFSIVPLAFALVVLVPSYLNWQNKRILQDIVKLCDNRLEQEMIYLWLAGNYSEISYDRSAYTEASKKIIAELIQVGYAKPHIQIKRKLEEFTWITETGNTQAMEEIQTLFKRLDNVLRTLNELLRYSLVEEEGVFASLSSVFADDLDDLNLRVDVNCNEPDRRLDPRLEKQIAEGCMLLLIEMSYNRTGNNIIMDLTYRDKELVVDIYDDDESYTNVDLLLQPPSSWPFNFLFVRMIVKKYLKGKFTGPLNYHGGLHLQARIPLTEASAA